MTNVQFSLWRFYGLQMSKTMILISQRYNTQTAKTLSQILKHFPLSFVWPESLQDQNIICRICLILTKFKILFFSYFLGFLIHRLTYKNLDIANNGGSGLK